MHKITIAGAGLVGSLLAMYLAKKGFDVHVYERRPDMRKQVVDGGRSINLALSDRGWKALEEVGVANHIRQIAIPMYGRMVHNIDGSLSFQPYGKEGQCIYSVSRADLNKTLMNCADDFENVHFYFNQRCTKIDLNAATLYLQDQNTGTANTAQADVVFGADGAFSAVRGSMQFTDRFDYAQDYIEHGYKELTIPPGPNGSWLMEKNALHIWPRKSFMLIALPNTDGSFTCTLFLEFEGNPSFEMLKTEAGVNDFFDHYFPDAKALMPTLMEDFFHNPTSSLVLIRCKPWVYNHKIALIGDAAHAIVPFYGQGMNCGFEDCSVLNNILNQHMQPDGSIHWPHALQQYQQSRIPDANAIAELALRNFVEMRDLVADPDFILRKEIERRLNLQYENRYIPLYSMVTFSPNLPYSEALRIGKLQDQLFAKIMGIPNVEEKWDNGQLTQILDQYMDDYLKQV
ncbi:FAD-dependent monooxygenase [Sphingobacteriales bacterium UPWRP_1]|nr:kynurenine 3-monooxygenase [Sphingobacteriales bacterium TSM_CSM]PSJ79133.1 FAD-dependent monooxygenase [Sphingobacteriales bacterium UPWRP_1]